MFKEAITFEPLEVQLPRRAYARLLGSRLQVNAAFCVHNELGMSFILSADRVDGPATVQAFAAYQKYLASVRDQLPSGVAQIAPADWYYDSTDPRCPHDAWLESMSLHETARGERQEIRSVSMTVRLLGAYHDGYIELQYRDVTRYTLDFTSGRTEFGGHHDWLYDEFRLTPSGRVEHEIEWAGRTHTGHWIIEAADLEYRWSPM